MSDFQYGMRATVGIIFHYVVIANATSNNAHAFVIAIHITVVRRFFRSFEQVCLFFKQCVVASAGNAGEQYELSGIFYGGKRRRSLWLKTFNTCP